MSWGNQRLEVQTTKLKNTKKEASYLVERDIGYLRIYVREIYSYYKNKNPYVLQILRKWRIVGRSSSARRLSSLRPTRSEERGSVESAMVDNRAVIT